MAPNAQNEQGGQSPQTGGIGRPYPPPPKAEPSWPALVAVLGAIAVQLLLPDRVTVGPHWVLPALEAALLCGLAFATPTAARASPRAAPAGGAGPYRARQRREHRISLALLAHELLHHNSPNGRRLIVAGALIWLTNVAIFALWYWEIDRGGPGQRAAGRDGAPDFLFVQMNDDRILPPGWRPRFIDYMYVSLTNAAAFSPTDTMPLSPSAKMTMGVQSLVSLVTIGLVVSRAVNILQ